MITGTPKPKPPTVADVDALKKRVQDLEVIVLHLADKIGVKDAPKIH